MRLIAIVLGEEQSKVRNSEAMGLLDYGFSTTKVNILKKQGTTIKEISQNKANKEKIEVILKNDLGIIEEKDTATHKYKYTVKMNKINLPIKKNQVIGKIIVKVDNKEIASQPLIAKEEVDKLNYFELLLNNLKSLCNGYL